MASTRQQFPFLEYNVWTYVISEPSKQAISCKLGYGSKRRIKRHNVTRDSPNLPNLVVFKNYQT